LRKVVLKNQKKMVREGKEIEEIIRKTYDEALEIEDKVKALDYFKKTFDGLEKSGYDISEYREDSFELIMDIILAEGEDMVEDQNEYEGLRYVGDNFKRIEDAGYNISIYKPDYIYMFEDYTGLILN